MDVTQISGTPCCLQEVDKTSRKGECALIVILLHCVRKKSSWGGKCVCVCARVHMPTCVCLRDADIHKKSKHLEGWQKIMVERQSVKFPSKTLLQSHKCVFPSHYIISLFNRSFFIFCNFNLNRVAEVILCHSWKSFCQKVDSNECIKTEVDNLPPPSIFYLNEASTYVVIYVTSVSNLPESFGYLRRCP